MGACGAFMESDAWTWKDFSPVAMAHAHSNEPQSLQAWLSSRGCNFKHCEITPPTADSASSRAVVVSPTAHPRQLQRTWWHRIWGPGHGWLLATFPLGNAITASTATRHPLLGRQFQQLLEQGVLDPRHAVMLLLIVEKMRGEASPYHPWLAALPTRMDTPLHFSEEEMAELRGTALQAASSQQREVLEATWKRGGLRLIATDLLQQAGVEGEVQLEDFLWAHSIYWSRAQSLPLKGGARGGEGVEVVEAIVPGLDFCNHSLRPTCWWQVQSSGREEVVQLRVAPGSSMAPGQEATISYGERSNEALLFAYGFALPANPHDAVMVHCPLPPSNQWDDVLAMRVQLLRARGLAPRFFLPASTLLPQPGQQAAEEEGWDGLMQQEVGRVLEVFVMPLQRVAAALQQLESGEQRSSPAAEASSSSSSSSRSSASAGTSSEGSKTSSSMDDRLEAAGLQMGVTSTLVRLLELKLIELEGNEGTGRLEKDQQALAAGAGSMSPRRWSSLVYRAEQKRLVRAFLARARVEMSRVMARMDKLQQEAGEGEAQ